ncbi:MAG: AAA family ATPase [Alphaproteobacteria bacterium]|nr:AAA family ATPase [Alphaproteobacteria bacterium]
MAIIIGLVGLSGTGKSEASRILTELAALPSVYFGDVVITEVRARGLDVTPDSERQVREDLRVREGMAVMARRKLPEIRAALDRHGKVLIDGIYSYSELRLLRESFGAALIIVAIHAARSVRAARLAARPVRPLSREEMDARDAAEVEKLEKAQPIALADFHVVNDGTTAELTESLIRIHAALTA